MADVDITHQQILDKIDAGNKQLLDALSQQLGVIADNMMTRDDVKEVVHDELAAFDFATKDDVREIVQGELTGYATKDDLKAFATKNDLKTFATKEDLKGLEWRMDQKFATKDDLECATVRLERQMASSRATNVKHHLETRKAIGDLTKDLADMREAW